MIVNILNFKYSRVDCLILPILANTVFNCDFSIVDMFKTNHGKIMCSYGDKLSCCDLNQW